MDSQHSTDAEETPTTNNEKALHRPLRDVLDGPIDTKLQLLEHHADMARLLAEEILEEEVNALAGERHSRDHPCGKPLRRWGYDPGSISIDGEKVPIEIPRLRDKNTEKEHTLESYQAMKEAEVGKELTDSILLGLSQGDYGRVASQFIDGFGLSQSSVSRRFLWAGSEGSGGVRESLVGGGELPGPLNPWEARGRRADHHLHGRDREGIQEGPRLHASDHRTQATTERHGPVVELLRGLLDRGLSFEEGILCVVDGGRGLRKAIEEVFGKRAEIHRCQWHKRENVISYLPKADQKKWRKKLQRAYQEPTYEAAKERLRGLHAELQQINRKAARSLQEGLEDTLTLHRLGLFEELGRSLKTTNCIENLNEQVEGYTDNVKRWHHSPQRYRWMALALLRWMALALLEAESRMRRLTGYEKLPKLKLALKETIPDRE